MSLSNVYTAGLQNVGSYQVSGVPFATGSINVSSSAENAVYKISFPSVTKWVQVFNHDPSTPLWIGFSETGLLGTSAHPAYPNYHFKIPPARINTGGGGNTLGDSTLVIENGGPNSGSYNSTTGRMDLKLTELYLSGASQDVSVVAGLTYIRNERVLHASPDGPNWSGSVGVG